MQKRPLVIPMRHHLNHVMSRYLVIGSNRDHAIVFKMLATETTKNNKKKLKSSKKNLKATPQRPNSFFSINMPHKISKEVQVYSLSELLSAYGAVIESNITHELVTQITDDIAKGVYSIDYLIVERKEMPALKMFARKLNKLGLMPSLEEGTIVENHEEFLLIKKKLISSNSYRVRKFHRVMSVKVGSVSMPLNEIEENLIYVLNWFQQNFTKREFTRLFLSTFNSDSEIFL